MLLPPARLIHTVLVEAPAGTSGTGPVFDPPVQVRCFVEDRVRRSRGGETSTDTITRVLYAQLDAPITRGARITHDGRVGTALDVAIRDGGPRTPNHLEVQVS